MADNDTGMLVKYVIIVSVVAVLALSMFDWDPSAPTVSGWSNLQTTLQADPFADAPPWPDFGNYTDTFNNSVDWSCNGGPGAFGLDCIWEALVDFFTWFSGFFFWIGGAFLWVVVTIGTAIWYIGLVLVWFAGITIAFFGALIGTAFLMFDGVPPVVQGVMWIVIVPFLAFLFFLVLRFLRGQS